MGPIFATIVAFEILLALCSGQESDPNDLQCFKDLPPRRGSLIGQVIFKKGCFPKKIGKLRVISFQRPWMVSIGYETNEQWTHKCIGTILSQNSIITSAECVEQKGNLKLRTGDEDLTKPDDNALAKTYDLGNVLVHPNRNVNGMEHDLALILLEIPLDFNENTKAICLPDKAELEDDKRHGHYSIASGWGQDLSGDVELQEVAVTIFSKKYCASKHPNLPDFTNTSEVICAGHDRELDFTCPGDSGAPLIVRQFFESGISYFNLVGVHHQIDFKNCLKVPALFARIDDPSNLNWIKEKML